MSKDSDLRTMRRNSIRLEGGYGESFLIGTVAFVVIGLSLIVTLSVIPFILKRIAQNAKMVDDLNAAAREAAEATGDGATAAPIPAPAPAVESAPVDFSWLWITLGALGAIALLALTAFLVYNLVSRLRRNARALKAEREAIAEDHRQALVIWEKFTAMHRALKGKVLQIETDWDMLFKYPALVDASVPQTRDFHRAIQAADSHSTEPPAGLNLSMAIGELPYPALVQKADLAWQSAWSFAKKTGTKLIPRDERKKIDQIVKLLKLARNGGGSKHERAVAYRRVEKLIAELNFVKVPDVAMRSMEAESRLMIEAATPTGATPSSKAEPIALGV